MTAVPPPVPPEIVRRAAVALAAVECDVAANWDHVVRAKRVLAAVYGDIVEAARRDALDEAIDVAEETLTYGARHHTVNALLDLRDATAPRTAPAATVSDQGAVPRIPGTDEAQIGVQGRDLMRDLDTYRRWNEGTHLDDDYPTTGEATDAHQRIFAAVPRLLALVAAQAEQIAEMEGEVLRLEGIDFIHAGCAGLREKDNAYLIAERERAEAAIARVRALCDEAWDPQLGGSEPIWVVDRDALIAALDGTEELA